ncbi:MAG: MFS family permease [Candidatus Endobugula sp.]|jgi:MFS family permease
MNAMKDCMLFVSMYLGAVSYGAVYLMTIYSKSINGDESNVGVFLLLAGLSTLIITGFTGKISKKIGADKACVIGCLLIAIAFFMLSSRESVDYIYYLSGLIIGLGWSIFYAAGPMLILESVEKSNRGRYISLISVCIVCGTATLPITYDYATYLKLSIKELFFITFYISLICSVFCMITGKLFTSIEKKTGVVDKNTHKKNVSFFEAFGTNAKYSLVMVLLGACIFSSMMNFQTSYAEYKGLNFSIFYFIYMVSVISSRIFFGGVLSAKNPIAPTPILLSIMLLGLILMLFNEGDSVLYAICAIFLGVSYGLVYPLIKTYAVNSVDTDDARNMVAYFTLTYFFGVYFFPLLGGVVIKNGGYESFIMLLILICTIDLFVGLIGYVKSKDLSLASGSQKR